MKEQQIQGLVKLACFLDATFTEDEKHTVLVGPSQTIYDVLENVQVILLEQLKPEEFAKPISNDTNDYISFTFMPYLHTLNK